MAIDQDTTYTERLKQLMEQRQIRSFKALRMAAQVSEGVLRHLRSGQAGQIRLDALGRLSQTLGVPLPDLLRQFDDTHQIWPVSQGASPAADNRRQGLQPSQQQFQQTSLAVIESWLLQWPTAAAAAQANPSLPASRLLPLLKPLEDLLASWQVRPIGEVGAEMAYDPHLHQLLEGAAQPGDPVRVRYVGYRHGERLLHRAKVSPTGP